MFGSGRGLRWSSGSENRGVGRVAYGLPDVLEGPI
jgi:hypothetical protein